MGSSEVALQEDFQPGGRAQAAGDPRPPRVWIEVDDLLRHYDGSLTPTGIDRVQAELFRPLVASFPDRISFMRIGTDSRMISLLNYKDVRRLADGNEYLARHKDRPALLPLHRLYRYLSRRASMKARELRGASDRRRFEASVRPGDAILCIGGSWTHANFAESIAELKQRHGIRFVVMYHDLLPVTHPQFVAPRHIPTFTSWLHAMAGVVDLALTPSKSSANALAEWMVQAGYAVPPIRPIRFGAGFPSTTSASVPAAPVRRRHVLYVSTIEIRKNHMTLFRIWERFIARHGPDNVPELLFAGKFGWEIEELKAALARTSFLNGKIRAVGNLTDAEMARLYRESRFTVFPSACEGWGLPVAESLYFGRYCIASNATSVPEVGGRFVDYHDPFDIDEAYRLIERALFEPGFVEEKERLITAEYVRPTWEDAAGALMSALDSQFRGVPA